MWIRILHTIQCSISTNLAIDLILTDEKKKLRNPSLHWSKLLTCKVLHSQHTIVINNLNRGVDVFYIWIYSLQTLRSNNALKLLLAGWGRAEHGGENIVSAQQLRLSWFLSLLSPCTSKSLHCHRDWEKPIQESINTPSQQKCTTVKATNSKLY